MDAPLRLPDAFDGTDQQPAAEPQPLPKELRDDIQRGMALLQQRLGMWGAGAVTTLWIWSLGFCAYRALSAVGAEPAANVMAVTFAAFGAIAIATCNYCAPVIVPHVFSRVDEARVSAKGTGTLSKTMTGMKAVVGFNVLIQVCVSVVLVIEFNPNAPQDWVPAALAVALAVPQPVITTPILVAHYLAYLLAADAAEQVAAEVQRATAATADYNGLAKRVYRVHRDTVALSERMTPIIFCHAGFHFLAMSMFVYIAVGPRPPRGTPWFGTGNWYNFFFHQYVAGFLATIMAANLTWGLSGPAKVTSACQRIASAVNDLRLNAGGADGTVTLATSEQLHRIEGLERYINALNKNQGLGFLVLRKRITFTLVMGLLIQTVSAMPVVITLMSIATGEHEVSHQDLNNTLTDIFESLDLSDGG